MTPPGGARRGDGDPLVMSVADAARLLGISKTLAYDLVARQELPSLRLGEANTSTVCSRELLHDQRNRRRQLSRSNRSRRELAAP